MKGKEEEKEVEKNDASQTKKDNEGKERYIVNTEVFICVHI